MYPRIGWLASTDAAVMDKVALLKNYTTICSSRPSEILAQIALQNRSKIVSHLRNLLLENKSYLKSFVHSNSDQLKWIEPEGGSFAFVELVNGQSAAEYTTLLMEEGGVAVMPGDLFEGASETR